MGGTTVAPYCKLGGSTARNIRDISIYPGYCKDSVMAAPV